MIGSNIGDVVKIEFQGTVLNTNESFAIVKTAGGQQVEIRIVVPGSDVNQTILVAADPVDVGSVVQIAAILVSLPVGSVVLMGEATYAEKKAYDLWNLIGEVRGISSQQLLDLHGPATVMYLPAE